MRKKLRMYMQISFISCTELFHFLLGSFAQSAMWCHLAAMVLRLLTSELMMRHFTVEFTFNVVACANIYNGGIGQKRDERGNKPLACQDAKTSDCWWWCWCFNLCKDVFGSVEIILMERHNFCTRRRNGSKRIYIFSWMTPYEI